MHHRTAAAKAFARRAWPVAVLVAGGTLPLLRLLADPLHSVPGSVRTDVYKHVWSYWHTLKILGEGSLSWTSYLNAPGGGVLLDVMLVPSLLLAPVTWLAGVVAAANLWVWLSLVATGICTWALCREITGSDLGGVVGGLLAQTAPYLMSYPLFSGVHERLTVWAFPLVLLGLLRLRSGRSWGWIPILGGVFVLTAASCAIHGYIAALVCLFTAPMLVPGPAGPGAARGWIRPALGIAITLGLFALVMWLDFLWYRWASYHPWTLSYQGDWIEKRHGLAYSSSVASLAGMFVASVARATGRGTTNDELYMIWFVGIAPAVAAVAGVLAAPRGRRLRVGTPVAVALLLCSLALGQTFECGGQAFSNPPFRWLAALLPYFGVRVTHWQLVAAFGPLSAVGIAALVARPPRGWMRLLVAVLVVGVTLVERVRALPFPLVVPAAPAHVSSIYDAVQPDGGLVDVPRFWYGLELTPGAIFLAQTRHERPIQLTVNINQSVWDNVLLLRDGCSGRWPIVAPALRRARFRWVVVHRDWMVRAEDAETSIEALRKVAGPPVADNGTEVLFDLSSLAVTPDPDLVWKPGQQDGKRRGSLPDGARP